MLLSSYYLSDITALAKDKAYAQISLDEMTIHQVIARKQLYLVYLHFYCDLVNWEIEGCQVHVQYMGA